MVGVKFSIIVYIYFAGCVYIYIYHGNTGLGKFNLVVQFVYRARG